MMSSIQNATEQRFSRSVAFSLIELLVVVAVIGILASLLLPVLRKAKEKAKSVVCLGNLNQLGLAVIIYSDDNVGKLPYNPSAAGISPSRPGWAHGIMSYDASGDSTNIQKMFGTDKGRIGAYTKSPRIYRCPADLSVVELGGRKVTRVRSYSMNQEFGNSVDSITTYAKESDIPHPSRLCVFVDEHEDSIEDAVFPTPPPITNGIWFDALPASHHGRSGAFSFADGHTELKKWVDPRTVQPVRLKWISGLRADGSPDLEWLRERAR